MPGPIRSPTPGPLEFMSLVFDLLARGYTVELKASGVLSYHAVVRCPLDLVVGDLQYRHDSEEVDSKAQGISYSSWVTDPQYNRDATFDFVVHRMFNEGVL